MKQQDFARRFYTGDRVRHRLSGNLGTVEYDSYEECCVNWDDGFTGKLSWNSRVKYQRAYDLILLRSEEDIKLQINRLINTLRKGYDAERR